MRHNENLKNVFLFVTALATFLATAVVAGGASAQESQGVAPPWSAERLRNAQPKPLPEASRDAPPALAPLEIPSPGPASPGRPPVFDPGDALDERLYWPDPENAQPSDASTGEVEPGLAPQAVGPAGAAFTQSRVFPPLAVRTFPYRAIGKLFFFDPVLARDFTCTAFVIERSVVATAGHCVFDFVGRRGYFVRDFLFVPAFDRGRAPFGGWSVTAALPARSWQQGDGRLPHRSDFAVLTIQERVVDGQRAAIGDVVGWLGWQLQATPDHATLIGYPLNLDGGNRMQQTHAGLFLAFPPNDIEFGSAQGGGASGGPIVEDFGVPALGQPPIGNRVVSVISFGSDELWTLGGSILNQEFAELMARACRQRPRNCS